MGLPVRLQLNLTFVECRLRVWLSCGQFICQAGQAHCCQWSVQPWQLWWPPSDCGVAIRLSAAATMPDGRKDYLSEAQVTGMVLNEFYQKTQVTIGEAVAGSELGAMIREHSSELRSGPPPPVKSVKPVN